MKAVVCEQFRMTSTDGLQVVYARWRNRQPPRGLLQIAHGMGEHIGRYQVLIEELASARRTGRLREGSSRARPNSSIAKRVRRIRPLWVQLNGERHGPVESQGQGGKPQPAVPGKADQQKCAGSRDSQCHQHRTR